MSPQDQWNPLLEGVLLQKEIFGSQMPSRLPATERRPAPRSETGEQARFAVGETDPGLAALLNDRRGRVNRKSKSSRWMVNLLFLGFLGGSAAALMASPELRGMFGEIMVGLEESAEENLTISKVE